jgi:hypothetical protein
MIEVLKQALDALELEDLACRYEKEQTPEHIAKAITSLRQAIEQAQKQEPVGEVELIDIDDEGTASAWFTIATEMLNLGDKLYTTPPQRQPLTDEEMWKLWNAQGDDFMEQQAAIAFARAIEAAHGITGEQK